MIAVLRLGGFFVFVFVVVVVVVGGGVFCWGWTIVNFVGSTDSTKINHAGHNICTNF